MIIDWLTIDGVDYTNVEVAVYELVPSAASSRTTSQGRPCWIISQPTDRARSARTDGANGKKHEIKHEIKHGIAQVWQDVLLATLSAVSTGGCRQRGRVGRRAIHLRHIRESER